MFYPLKMELLIVVSDLIFPALCLILFVRPQVEESVQTTNNSINHVPWMCQSGSHRQGMLLKLSNEETLCDIERMLHVHTGGAL